MSRLSEVMDDCIPRIYAKYAAALGNPTDADMSRSRGCHAMSKDLMVALQSGGHTLRRELHGDAESRYCVIAHAAPDAVPSPEDLITDLTPWDFLGGERYSGWLHGPREKIMLTLQTTGAPEALVALRATESILIAHAPATWPVPETTELPA